jgi:hypothetical protein
MNVDRLQAFTEQIRALPFVRDLRFSNPKAGLDRGFDAIAVVKTTRNSYHFDVTVKLSYLDHSSVNALIAAAQQHRKERNQEVIVFARYIPRPTGERLVDNRINFVDLAGNMNLSFGQDHHRTILGRREDQKTRLPRRITPAKVQFLFTVAAHPESAAWPVRQLASVAGISKSKAAELSQELMAANLLEKRSDVFYFRTAEQQKDQLLTGYAQVLRPKLFIKRFRSSDQDPGVLLKRLTSLKLDQLQYSLTGGPAADLLQHFYRGLEIPVFLAAEMPALQQQLRLLPDKNGPVVFLRSFGTLTSWKEIDGIPIAHPWLIYAELMQSDDPRAHEAAEELRREFLTE